MSLHHSQQQHWTPGRLKLLAADIGPQTLRWVCERLEEKTHPEQACYAIWCCAPTGMTHAGRYQDSWLAALRTSHIHYINDFLYL